MPDQALCINNLYTLSKQKNMKIRALETSCGVSVGYLARLRQDVLKRTGALRLSFPVSRWIPCGRRSAGMSIMPVYWIRSSLTG